MKSDNFFYRILDFITRLVIKSTYVQIYVLPADSGMSIKVYHKPGVSFSELDELYGEGNWKL